MKRMTRSITLTFVGSSLLLAGCGGRQPEPYADGDWSNGNAGGNVEQVATGHRTYHSTTGHAGGYVRPYYGRPGGIVPVPVPVPVGGRGPVGPVPGGYAGGKPGGMGAGAGSGVSHGPGAPGGGHTGSISGGFGGTGHAAAS